VKHYKLTDEYIEKAGRKLYRIQATVDMPQHGVKAGDLGGFVESYENLLGNAWVADNAKVFDNARVFENAKVFGNAQVSGNARVFENAQVYGNARVSENAKVYGNALVYRNALITDNSTVYGNARVYGNVQVYGDAWVCLGNISKQNQLSTFQIGKGFHATVTPKHATIGCTTKTHKEWLKVTKKQAVKMGLPAKLYNVYKSTLKAVIRR